MRTMLCWLECRFCGYRAALGPLFGGCPNCAEGGRREPLEAHYDYPALQARVTADWWSHARGFWDFRPLLPLPDSAIPLSLGEGSTPLVRSQRLSQASRAEVFLKNESANPTWAHKDRFHAVAGSLAAHFGFGRVATTSTGNHGASAAAYASAAGLGSLVLCPPETSGLLRDLIVAYGGHVVTADWELRPRLLARLFETGSDWYPSTGLDPGASGPANPFGVEGYKTIAYELANQLGRAPDHLFIAVASGDTVYGVWKGFRELQLLGRIDRPPRVHACQPSGANVLEPSLTAGLERAITLEHPYSIATSTREPTSSRYSLVAIRESQGTALSASDAAILEAMHDLAVQGFCVEPASAVPVACLRTALDRGLLRPGETAVCLVTSAGIKWPGVFNQHLPHRQATVASELDFDHALARFGMAGAGEVPVATGDGAP